MDPLENLFSDFTGQGSPSHHYQGHSVIVCFNNYAHEELDLLHELEDRLREALAPGDVGLLDGHEINMDGTDGCLFLYGPNAEVLFKTIKPVLEQADFMKGAVARLRFGATTEASANEIDVEL